MVAENEDGGQKTEYPTGKRLGEARSRGQLPISREVTAWVSLLGILIVVGWVGPDAIGKMMSIFRSFLESPDAIRLDDHNVQTIIFDALGHVAMATGLMFLIMAAAAILGTMAQTGLFASWDLIKPDLTKLSLIGGWKRLFSMHAGVDIIKSLCKLIVLSAVAYTTVKPLIDDLPVLTGSPMMMTIGYLHHQAIHLLIVLLTVFTLVAVGDWFYQRYEYIENLRMTKTEVKDEFRQQEGDPIVKSRLRQIRIDRARKRMMAQVPKADVVITNPTHYAIALQYDNTRMTAPLVLAKGTDRIAERIRALAEEHKIPLVSNPPLARALHDSVEVDQEIPTQHYRAVAEIISYVYKLRKKKL